MGIPCRRRYLCSLYLIASALAVSTTASGQVLNLSRDLVAKNIAASNMTPDMPGLDARPLFEAGVNYASVHHIPRVIADRGSYYFLSLSSQYQHVYLNQISNVAVDLQHSDLYFAHGNIMAIDIASCTNLTLENFTIDYLQLPFTQLTASSVDTVAKKVYFTQFGSYPLPSAFNSLTVPSTYVNDGFYLYVFRNGQELISTGRMSVSAGALNDTYIQLAGTEPWTTATQLGTIQAGDTLALEWRAGIGAIFASSSTGITVHDVSVYASGFIGVFTNMSSGVTVDHVQVMPRPATDRMLGTNADGIHLGATGGGNVVTNNTVKRTCDDAIAMDGQWAAIVSSALSTTQVVVKRNIGSPLPIESAFDFISVIDDTLVGTATVIDEYPEPPAQTGASGETITLTLATPIAGLLPNFGVMPHDPSLRGSPTLINGNLTQEIVFGRGIYPAGEENVTITDNLVEMTNRCGIVVEQDEGLAYNYKTAPSSGIAIRNNIVDNALGYGVPSDPLLMDAAAINTVAYNEYFDWVSTQSLSNISIDGNFVTNCIRSGIRMENVNAGDITGNLVLNYGTQPDSALWFLPVCAVCETLAQVEADFAEAVLVVNSTSVTDASNSTTGTPVENESFADGSRRLAPESIAVALGQNFTSTARLASGPILPYKLAGLEVNVKDSLGVSRPAGLYYASPSQVTYVVPQGTAPGVATVTVGGEVSGALISSVAPALFSADGTGAGVALAFAQLDIFGGWPIPEIVFQCAAGCVALPLDLGNPWDTLLVYFQATGIRGRSSLANVVAEVGGVPALVEAAEQLPGFEPGADYVAVSIPHSLAGAGLVPVVLTVDGFTANVVMIDIR
jgi:uncharacterized protein (TIGR03437 family)